MTEHFLPIFSDFLRRRRQFGSRSWLTDSKSSSRCSWKPSMTILSMAFNLKRVCFHVTSNQPKSLGTFRTTDSKARVWWNYFLISSDPRDFNWDNWSTSTLVQGEKQAILLTMHLTYGALWANSQECRCIVLCNQVNNASRLFWNTDNNGMWRTSRSSQVRSDWTVSPKDTDDRRTFSLLCRRCATYSIIMEDFLNQCLRTIGLDDLFLLFVIDRSPIGMPLDLVLKDHKERERERELDSICMAMFSLTWLSFARWSFLFVTSMSEFNLPIEFRITVTSRTCPSSFGSSWVGEITSVFGWYKVCSCRRKSMSRQTRNRERTFFTSTERGKKCGFPVG